jgi:threonine dehydrogenase-like Zn-dependent dehydrogenase
VLTPDRADLHIDRDHVVGRVDRPPGSGQHQLFAENVDGTGRTLWTGSRWNHAMDLMPMVADGSDPPDVVGFATHHLPLDEAPHGYEIFRNKADGCIKVVLQP